MEKISRRAALGSVASSAFVGLGVTAGAAEHFDQEPTPKKKTGRPVKPMTLEEFRQTNGPVAADELLQHIDGHTFTMCHEDMRDEHGIWIPELVPVFEKLDAMRAAKT